MSFYESKQEREKRLEQKRLRQFTTVGDKPTDRKEFVRQYQAEQDEIASRPAKAAAKRLQELTDANIAAMRELNSDFVNFWSQSPEAMNIQSAVFDSIEQNYDLGTSATSEERRQALSEFSAALDESSITLSDEARAKLAVFIRVLNSQDVAYTVKNLVLALLRLRETGIFVEGRDGTGLDQLTRPTAPKPAPVVVPEPTPDIEGLRMEHREERKQIVGIVNKEWGGAFEKIFYEWCQSLRDKWNYILPVDELGPKVAAYMKKNNLSPFARPTYDRIRVVFSRLGLFRGSEGQALDLRLPDEILADQVEDADLSSFDVRRDLNYRTQELRR
jgi:hypothetical protein